MLRIPGLHLILIWNVKPADYQEQIIITSDEFYLPPFLEPLSELYLLDEQVNKFVRYNPVIVVE